MLGVWKGETASVANGSSVTIPTNESGVILLRFSQTSKVGVYAVPIRTSSDIEMHDISGFNYDSEICSVKRLAEGIQISNHSSVGGLFYYTFLVL